MILDRIASRRHFLKVGAAAGGGMVLSLGLPFAGSEAQPAGTASFNAFVRIAGNGQVTMIMPYVEMGQATYTSIPMLIAEELEVDLKQVQLEHAPPDAKLYGNPVLGGEQVTGNSSAVRAAWLPMRQAGAVARTMLVAAAAKRWNVDPSSCRAQSGEVLHRLGEEAHLRRACRRGRQDAGAQGCRAQATEGLQADRHAPPSASTRRPR